MSDAEGAAQPTLPPSEAHRVYAARLLELREQQQQLRLKDRVFGWSKVVCAALAFGSGIWLARTHPALLGWALLPAVAFVLLWFAKALFDYFFTSRGDFWRLVAQNPELALSLLAVEESCLVDPAT